MAYNRGSPQSCRRKGREMKRLLADGRKARVGRWACAAALALVFVGAMATPARAGGVHLSFGIGIPVPVYAYPSYPTVVHPYPPPYYAYGAPPVYPPVWFSGHYRSHHSWGGHGHHHGRPGKHYHGGRRHHRH
jgi:hypothetical protein